MRLRELATLATLAVSAVALGACSSPRPFEGRDSAVDDASMMDGGSDASASCGQCSGRLFTNCNEDGTPGAVTECPNACMPGVGCVTCAPGRTTCVGNEVRRCGDDGQPGAMVVETCDAARGMVCDMGMCRSACQVAEASPSNVGCEFWAVDLDQQDGLNDPASAPWGVAISNVGTTPAEVTIEINTAPVGQPVVPMTVLVASVPPNSLRSLRLPTRELDCGTRPNDYASPGTCLSSNAYRIRSNAPIIVYQFNVFENAFSNDASLLLPTTSLGRTHRVIGWPAGHPIPVFGIIDRSYVTVVGVRPNTRVTVRPTWRIRGNPPIAATMPGGEIVATIGPFDVLNLETADGTVMDDTRTIADLSGTSVVASEPVAVFSGVETTSAPGGVVNVPTPPGWSMGDTCCLDHLEEQMFPVESIGTRYVIPRSPVRSTGRFREADILRFVGAAEPATVTTTLPAPFDRFTLMPGEVRTTHTQDNVVVTSDKPVIVGQILVSNQYVDGPALGDPSLTVFPPVDQFRADYVVLTPPSWTQNWAVLVAEPGAMVTIDGSAPSGCIVEPAGDLAGTRYETRRCPLMQGSHHISGDRRFGVVMYGYGSAGSYAFVGGADVRRIYDPPG
ncbi:MAG: IgGFc-binding protein [Myxococcales bacterium]|nr:IgGFc-binding protein [Myxococcales bacterium]